MVDAFQWATADRGPEPPAEAYCGTRDVAVARLDAFRSFAEHQGVMPNTAALIAAIAGELTNNCFDHNLGTWHDVPGCWFFQTIAKSAVEVIVADRGQGFLGSLRRVRPELRDAADALLTAFTTRISGRAPEQRGKGLRFILDALAILPGTTFLLRTGNARLSFQSPITTAEIFRAIESTDVTVPGTYATLTVPEIHRIVGNP